jgi:molecular chaperone DnaK (HSP70)
MALSRKEQEYLEKLQRKAEEPDAPAVSKHINATVDLSDPKSIALAIKHGFLTSDEIDEMEEEEEDRPADDKPKRRAYFQEGGNP